MRPKEDNWLNPAITTGIESATTTPPTTDALKALTGFAPYTPLREGIGRFVARYRSYYG